MSHVSRATRELTVDMDSLLMTAATYTVNNWTLTEVKRLVKRLVKRYKMSSFDQMTEMTGLPGCWKVVPGDSDSRWTNSLSTHQLVALLAAGMDCVTSSNETLQLNACLLERWLNLFLSCVVNA